MKNKIKLAGVFGLFALYVVSIRTLVNSNYIGSLISLVGMAFLFVILIWVLDGIDEED